jgi:REP element-mobilizing transposase RayT
MPCLQRIEISGAATYVISRSNYRQEFFLSENTGTAFERTILETVDRCIWKLHAYVIMSHHYHLVIETPEPNLVKGIKCLQRTFATWFNRLRNVRRYVFEGRTESILIGEGRGRLGLVDYIHLRPVRVGLGKVKSRKGCERSNFPKYFKKSPRAGHCRGGFLGILGFPDILASLRRYASMPLISASARSKTHHSSNPWIGTCLNMGYPA